MKRCDWGSSKEMIEYHDKDWGVPVHDDRLIKFQTKFVLGTEVTIIDGSANRSEEKDQLNRYHAHYSAESDKYIFDFSLIYLVPSFSAEYCAKKFQSHIKYISEQDRSNPRGSSFILSWGVPEDENTDISKTLEPYKHLIFKLSVADMISKLLKRETIGDIPPIPGETKHLLQSLRNFILNNFDRSTPPLRGRFPNESQYTDSIGDFVGIYEKFIMIIKDKGGKKISARTSNTSIGVPIPGSGGLLFRILTCKNYYTKPEEFEDNIQDEFIIELDNSFSGEEQNIKSILGETVEIIPDQIHPNATRTQKVAFLKFTDPLVKKEKLEEFIDFCIDMRKRNETLND